MQDMGICDYSVVPNKMATSSTNFIWCNGRNNIFLCSLDKFYMGNNPNWLTDRVVHRSLVQDARGLT